MIVGTIVATILSAILYRLGGLAGWNKLYRRIGCMVVSGVWMILFFSSVPWYIHLVSAGFMYACLTTYWDSIFGYDNHYAHGAMIAFAYLPFAIVTGIWIPFVLRVIALSITMGVLSQLSGNDWVEELGRGGLIGLTLPILLV